MNRAVFHIRLKDFELQAERILDPALRTRPIAIISSNRQDGTIVALSNEARQEGLFQGLNVSLVRKMSTATLLLPYNSSLYARLNGYVYSTITDFTPVVEPAAYGQYFLDMSGMERVYRDARQTGFNIARQVQNKTSLSGVVGISPNKLVSSISTAVVPDIIHQVAAGNEPKFLAPLPTPVLPTSHERAVQRILNFLFLEQVHQIQAVADRPTEATTLFGNYTRKLISEARGQDTSLVQPPALKEHILEQTVLPSDTNDIDLLRAVVRNLAEQVAFKLRKRRQVARRIAVEIHYTDGLKNNRVSRLNINDDAAVTATCFRLFEQANYRRNRIRAVLINASDLRYHARQLDLFAGGDPRDRVLSSALDKVRKKYGFDSVGIAGQGQSSGKKLDNKNFELGIKKWKTNHDSFPGVS
ncbi:MAG: hypothetical protein KAK01_12190 [Candidatus Marinimicrobia bacterium]|nr:hypothetical protein [Candidatus Neomarinimicrobiota bacterium]